MAPPGLGEGGHILEMVTRKEEGTVGQTGAQAGYTSLALLFCGAYVGWGLGVGEALGKEQLPAFLQAAPVMLPARCFQLGVFGSRHLKSTPTLERRE